MNETEEQVEKIYNMLKDKAIRFSDDELERLIIFDGYDKNVAKKVIKRIKENKSKDIKQITQTPEEKQKILAEISKSLKDSSKNKTTLVAPKKDKKNLFTAIGTSFKKTYFFFEDIYYSMVDGINKVIPVGKLVDGIDKVFPSFILFIIFIIGLIWLIFFGILGGFGSPVLELTVTDNLDMPLSGATAILTIGDINKTSQTGTFGDAVFEDLKKKNLKLTITKESYLSQTKEIKLKNGTNAIKVKLDIDTSIQLHLLGPTTRNLIFKENEILLATNQIYVTLRCANSRATPDPNSTSTSSGQLTVDIPAGCGDLRLDVSSEHYNPIQNMLVPTDNTIMLTPVTQNFGTLDITVKDQNTQAAIPDVLLQLYKPDDSTTTINESNLVVSSGTTTVYGKYVFTNLPQGTYTLSASKEGYTSSLNRYGPYQIYVNNTSTDNIVLSRGGKTLNIVLIDANGNTTREIKGDISLYTKRIDSNLVTVIGTREDVNKATFTLPSTSGVTYKISVTNTENYGYFAPDILDLNYFDNNTTITIPLEYSSELNTGKIGVNVSRNSIGVTGASAYIFRDKDEDIPIAGPQITNTNGDCNFPLIRSGRRYFAYAIKSPEQGVSQISKLDANDFMELNVELEEQATILNLKVTPTTDYNIVFFKQNGDKITEYSVVNTSSDSNKEYIFRNSSHNFYALITAPNKATYQTSLITLIPGERIYRLVTLSNTHTNAFSNIELLGIYDESGNIDKNIINLATDYTKTFKLKFKLTTTNEENRESAYAYIRAGKRLSLPSDYLRLENVIAYESENEYGCNFSGETTDWNLSHFLAHYDTDHSQNNCSSSATGFKWVKIDFSDSDAEQIEFFVDVKFQNGLTNLSDYVIYYKGLTETEDGLYKLSPNLNASWQECDMVPEGYFYSPYSNRALTFVNSDYAFLSDIYDYNIVGNRVGQKLSPLGNSYILEIGKNYYFSQKLMYLKNNNTNNKDIVASSVNTYNNLIYKSYKLRINNTNQPAIDINASDLNAKNYSIDNLDATFGTIFDHNSVFSPIDFFISYSNTGNGGSNSGSSNTHTNYTTGLAAVATTNFPNNTITYDLNTDSNLTTDLLDLSGLNPYTTPILAYYPSDSNLLIEIITSDATGNNEIYVGDNNLSFRVRNISGQPIAGIKVTAIVSPQTINFGFTNNAGTISNKNLSLPLSKIGSRITFKFLFPSNYGLANNTYTISKLVKSNYKLYLENGTEISANNVIQYNVGRYFNNGVPKITKDQKNYYVRGSNLVYGKLTNADVYPNPTQYLNFSDINNYIYTQNNLPLYLSDLNRQIKTRISLSSLPASQINPKGPDQTTGTTTQTQQPDFSVTGGYHNIIELGRDIDSQLIKLDLNAPFKTNIFFDLNFSTEFVDLPKPGVRKQTDNQDALIVELIKNKSSNISFNYNIINHSTESFSVELVPEISPELIGYVTVNTFTVNSNPKPTHNLTITFDLNNNKVITSPIKNKPVILNLKYTINGIVFIEPIDVNVNIYDTNDAIIIEQDPIKTMDCTLSNCDVNLIVKAINKTRTYDFNLTKIQINPIDNNFLNIVTNPNPAFNINANGTTDTNREMAITFKGNYAVLKQTTNNLDYIRVIQKEINRNIDYNYKIIGINNSNSITTKSTKFKISVWLQTLEELLKENGLFSNMCLGVGGINLNAASNFYILGNCDIENQNDCKSGAEAKPKIIYDWSSSTTWQTECVENTIDGYNENKTHCDSLQTLFSILKLIDDASDGQFGEKYIYLMSDGVSKDLLSDFVNNTEFLPAVSIYWNNKSIFSDVNINNGKFSITKTEKDGLGNDINTLKPGKYKIIINSDFRKHQSTPLNIELELVREMPYTMRNLLYYVPIDADLGIIGNNQNKRSSRDGYGSSLTIDSTDNLPIYIKVGKEYYIYKSDGNKTRAIINLQYDADNFKNTLRSEGKLLDLTLTDINPNDQAFNINMVYSPSYPIPLYAKVENSNIFGLSYKLKENEITDIPITFSNFLIWQDYKNENKILTDGQYYSGYGDYIKSMIDGLKFKSIYGNNDANIILLKTTMYWPMNYLANDIANINLVLTDGPSCCGNHPESKIYTIRNLNGVIDSGSLNNITRVAQNTGTVDLKDLLGYIDNNACIRSGLTVTTIRWKDENVGFTTVQINQIIENSGVLGETTQDSTDQTT